MSEVRRLRGYVKINGALTPVLSFRTVENGHFQCDTFEFTLAAWQPAGGFGIDFWGDEGTSDVLTEIMLGFLEPDAQQNAQPSDLASLLIGEVDDIDADPFTGLITLTGRDLTGRLIDTKVSRTWPDKTASEIVTDLAVQAGLTPNVTATSIPVGKYAKGQYAALGRDMPVWDLISQLATAEGYDAYVKGTTLYFGPSQTDISDPLIIKVNRKGQSLTANVENVKLHRSLTLAKDISVTVISYSARKKVPIKAVARRQGAAKAASTSFRTGKTSQNYVIRKPGLTQQQADDLAQKTLTDLSKHERTFSADMAIDRFTASRGKATISGTGTSWDTAYFIDTVTRTYEVGEDHATVSMTVTAKNHQIESQAA